VLLLGVALLLLGVVLLICWTPTVLLPEKGATLHHLLAVRRGGDRAHAVLLDGGGELDGEPLK
jgi:hypothetical protein